MPHKMLAPWAIVNNPVLVNPNPAVNAWHQISMAVLAEPFFKGRRQPYLVLHGYPSCYLDIFIGKLIVFPEMLFRKPEKQINARFRYFLCFIGLFKMFFWHICCYFDCLI